MRIDLDRRLRKVAKKLLLVNRLRKVAFASEEEMIDRLGERSKKVLRDLNGKFHRAFKALLPTLPEKAQEVLTRLHEDQLKVITGAGVVDTDALEAAKAESAGLWKQLSASSRGASSALYFFNAYERFLTVAMLGARMQNYDLTEKAKTDPRYRDRLYKALEQMAAMIPQAQRALGEMQKALPVEAPPEAAPQAPKDSTSLEAVQQQLNSAESEMRGIVEQISKVLLSKARELFSDEEDLLEALEQNIISIYSNRKVNKALNRDKEFYKDALHLSLSGSALDLGEFLDTKAKKALYLSYRSFVMGARALGVMQTAAKNPEIVLKSEKAQELVVKAQQILQKRKDAIVTHLKALSKPKTKPAPDKERGIPRGTFTDFFDAQSA